MADNVASEAVVSAGQTWAVLVGSFSGDTAGFPACVNFIASGSEGTWTFTLPVGGAGAVSAGVQRMTLASDDPSVASLAIIDDWDESDRAKVNLIVGQAGIAAGAGAVGATVPRVTLASDDPGVALLGTIDTDTGNIATSVGLLDDTVGTIGATVPAKALLVGMSDGTNIVSRYGLPVASAIDNLTFIGTNHEMVLTFGYCFDGTQWDRIRGDSTNGLLVNLGTNNDVTVTGTVSGTGTAGSAATGVLTVQGIASMTPVQVSQVTASNLNATVVGTGTFAVQAAQSGTWDIGTLTTLTGGGVAHDSPDSGNPVKVGARAAATLSDDTMVVNADRTDLVSDLDGALITRPQFPLADLISERVSNTDGASTAFSNFGATANTSSYITAITVFRTDSGSTLAYVDFRDGTAGSVLFSVPLPPNGGATINLGGVPLFRTTENTALAYDVSAALTTVYISVSGFKSKTQ